MSVIITGSPVLYTAQNFINSIGFVIERILASDSTDTFPDAIDLIKLYTGTNSNYNGNPYLLNIYNHSDFIITCNPGTGITMAINNILPGTTTEYILYQDSPTTMIIYIAKNNGIALTDGNILVGSSGVATDVAVSGDLSMTPTGAFTTIRINGGPLGLTTPTDSNILIGDDSDLISNPVSGDVTLDSNGIITIVNSGVTAGTYTNSNITIDSRGIVTDASTSFLLNLDLGKIFVGNSSDLAIGVNVQGDLSLTPTGTFTTTGLLTVPFGTTAPSNGNILYCKLANSIYSVPITGDLSLSSSGALNLTSYVTPGTYTIANITTNSKGMITAITRGFQPYYYPTQVNSFTGVTYTVDSFKSGMIIRTLSSNLTDDLPNLNDIKNSLPVDYQSRNTTIKCIICNNSSFTLTITILGTTIPAGDSLTVYYVWPFYFY
jgi:hypothetical protein